MFRFAPALLLAVGLTLACADAAQAQDDDDDGAATPEVTTPPRDCVVSVKRVNRQICPSRRQRVRVCTGGGRRRTVEPLNCV